MTKYVVAKQHEGGRVWRTVVMDADRKNEVVWRCREVGWNKANRAVAERVARQMAGAVTNMQRVLGL